MGTLNDRSGSDPSYPRRPATAVSGGGACVVVGARESRAHGEGRQGTDRTAKTEEPPVDSGDQAGEAWLLGIQRKLYQWSITNPDDTYGDLWNWIVDRRNLRIAERGIEGSHRSGNRERRRTRRRYATRRRGSGRRLRRGRLRTRQRQRHATRSNRRKKRTPGFHPPPFGTRAPPVIPSVAPQRAVEEQPPSSAITARHQARRSWRSLDYAPTRFARDDSGPVRLPLPPG